MSNFDVRFPRNALQGFFYALTLYRRPEGEFPGYSKMCFKEGRWRIFGGRLVSHLIVLPGIPKSGGQKDDQLPRNVLSPGLKAKGHSDMIQDPAVQQGIRG